MELGATMELLGEEVGQLWGRRPPYIVGGGGQSNRYPPSKPAKSGTTAGVGGTTAEPAVLPFHLAILPRKGGERGPGP